MKYVQLAAVVVLCAFVSFGCRSATGRSFGQHWDDKTISAQVKTKLMTERFANLFSTGVGTQFGVVRLTGTVPTEQDRIEAERIAGRVAGVRGVENQIVVVPPNHGVATTANTGWAPAASPPSARPPVNLSGEVTAIDPASGNVTVRTPSGDVQLRVPASTAQSLQPGQSLSINTGR